MTTGNAYRIKLVLCINLVFLYCNVDGFQIGIFHIAVGIQKVVDH